MAGSTSSEARGSKGHVHISTDGAVGRIVLNNPARLNAISLSMWQSLDQAVQEFGRNAEIRCVIVAGEGGKAFASGADISEFISQRTGNAAVENYDKVARAAMKGLASFPKPTIAMIEGYCIGGGLALALTCDLRVASEDARFAIPAAKLGLGYDYPGIQKLVGLVGPAAAKMIFFSGRQFDGAKAYHLGVVDEIMPKAALRGYVDDLATAIVANAPMTIRAAKLAIDTAMADPAKRDVAACEAAERACFASADYAEGQRAFAEKRPPNFIGK
jgi:enoyl-CoA hydratase